MRASVLNHTLLRTLFNEGVTVFALVGGVKKISYDKFLEPGRRYCTYVHVAFYVSKDYIYVSIIW